MNDKMIEEMAKVIDDRLIEANNYFGSMNKGKGYWIAQKLVEHYQPKIPEGSVVLNNDEYVELIEIKNRVNKLWSIFRKELEDTRKETVKEILEEMLDFIHNETFRKGYEFKKVERKLKEIAKIKGVEVE